MTNRGSASSRPDVPLAEAALRFELWSRVADGVKWALVVTASWVPLQPLTAMVEDLSGKKTELDATMALSASLTYSAVTTVGWAVTAARGRRRRKSLEGLRRRTNDLERTLPGMRGEA